MKTILQNINKKVTGFLERIARANQKAFGDSHIDCCSINKTGTTRLQGGTQQSHRKQTPKP